MNRKALIAGIVIATIITAIVAWNAWLSAHDRRVIEKDRLETSLEAQQQSREQDQALMERREDRNAARAAERKDFDNATSDLPQSGLTDRQRRDACRQLRGQGEDRAILASAGCL